MKRFMTTQEAAEVIGCSPYTLREWARDGIVTAYRTPGGHWRFNPDDCLTITRRPSSPPPTPRRTTSRGGLLEKTNARRERQS